MKGVGTIAALVTLLGASCAPAQNADSTAPKAASDKLRPSPEMQRLLDVFAGNWAVAEDFEVSASRQGQMRQGTASFRAGPGFSLIEDYRSSGSAGELNFLALLWWDQKAQVYRLLTCANNDGCVMRGTAKWESNELVNSWEESVDGRKAAFKDSFVDISRSSFRLISEGSADGKVIWRVITKYTRIPDTNK